ncbi:MAG: flavoprotein [Ferroplasma sp. Type II]|jgi:phosphopantothenoylcysteine decarboxylase/phosphopantothenate--cysteine ligase|uniref:flavoprotein n=1 Tax=Ferroplasma sp. Type II TaxID=261388 RepID=UPI0003894240|nr:flavoprotein [Ferroplasma sp. Type II]EQB74559.1 MAG: flavoprotein [Ferroplasma sp. Type II]
MKRANDKRKITILWGITGSVGSVNIPNYLAQIMGKLNCQIITIMTKASQNFLSPYIVELITNGPVYRDMFLSIDGVKVPHIDLTKKADVFIVVPASANSLGKAANGVCDDLLSTSFIAYDNSIIFAPNMNEKMWNNKIVQSNVERLKSFGHIIIEPGEGIEISDGTVKGGSMPGHEKILHTIIDYLEHRC